MRAILAICVTSLLLNVAASDEKDCVPVRWSSSVFGKVAQAVGGPPRVITTRGMSFFDYEKKMEALINRVDLGNGQIFDLKTITDGNTNITYTYNITSGQCTEQKLVAGRVFKRVCRGDPELKIVGSLSIGGKMADLIEIPFQNTTTFTAFMRDSFQPVSQIVESNYYGIPQMFAFQYGNVTDDVKDSSVFDIPSACKPKPHNKVCASDQWEAVAIGQIAQVVQNKTMIIPMELKQSRDYTNKLEVARTEVEYNGQMVKSITILNWGKNEMHTLDPAKKKCTRSVLKGDMVKICSDSKDIQFGEHFTVDGRQAVTGLLRSEVYGNTTTSAVMFRDDLQVISTVSEQSPNGIPQMIALQYGNYTTGIVDPSVFALPDYCAGSQDVFG